MSSQPARKAGLEEGGGVGSAVLCNNKVSVIVFCEQMRLMGSLFGIVTFLSQRYGIFKEKTGFVEKDEEGGKRCPRP